MSPFYIKILVGLSCNSCSTNNLFFFFFFFFKKNVILAGNHTFSRFLWFLITFLVHKNHVFPQALLPIAYRYKDYLIVMRQIKVTFYIHVNMKYKIYLIILLHYRVISWLHICLHQRHYLSDDQIYSTLCASWVMLIVTLSLDFFTDFVDLLQNNHLRMCWNSDISYIRSQQPLIQNLEKLSAILKTIKISVHEDIGV